MSYIKQIMEYSKPLPAELQDQLKIQVKKLRAQDFSYE